MIKKLLKKWLREEIMNDYWQLIDESLKRKTRSRYIQLVNGRFYEIVRRYKSRSTGGMAKK